MTRLADAEDDVVMSISTATAARDDINDEICERQMHRPGPRCRSKNWIRFRSCTQIADKIAMKFSANCELQVNLKDLHQALLEFSSKYQHYENLYFTKINNPVAITQAEKIIT